ncbi:HprK-related kinase A [Roseateles oligotrophus]|uniref:HprK-related kinase A n=1 Tax=Roseateles oligotrophus TaxID=1769250 RepID=A0ABT2YD80_9BURK|nr:HprK-related kinase A [Roseateles oligotrophus]MCV2368003.1 HprK-related kinase A [Roseateles oligotrophus]
MRLNQLSQAELQACLSLDGLLIPCGTFSVKLRSDIPTLASGLLQLYGDFPLLGPKSYVDFEVELNAPSWLRRQFRPQVVLKCDGRIPFKPLPMEQAFAMLEWGLNWVISSHAHDCLVIHAAVVERDGRALILAADPGSGKSTLCAALVHRGWRLLSDELALVSLTDGLVRPIARPISLKNASIGIVRAFGPEVVVSEACHDTAKGSVAHMRPPTASVGALRQTAMPAMLVFPKYSAGAPLLSQPEGQAHAFIELTRHTFNFSVLAGEGFDALGRLIDRVRSQRIQYSSFDQVIPEIERLWQSAA